MQTTVQILGKPLAVHLSPAAEAALAQRDTPLLAEMELYFSCLIRKQVRFRDGEANGDYTPVNDHLAVRFHPVMTESCSVASVDGGAPPVSDFPIANPAAFVPHHLSVDFRNGRFSGEFDYVR